MKRMRKKAMGEFQKMLVGIVAVMVISVVILDAGNNRDNAVTGEFVKVTGAATYPEPTNAQEKLNAQSDARLKAYQAITAKTGSNTGAKITSVVWNPAGFYFAKGTKEYNGMTIEFNGYGIPSSIKDKVNANDLEKEVFWIVNLKTYEF